MSNVSSHSAASVLQAQLRCISIDQLLGCHMPAVVAAIVFAVIGYFLGLSVGLTGLLSALIIGALGSMYGSLLAKVGPRALWLPFAGSLLGLLGVVVVQVLSSPVGFSLVYYVFFSLLTGLCLTLLAAVLFQISPTLRDRVFKNDSTPR